MIHYIGTQTTLTQESNGIQASSIEACKAYCETKAVLGVDTETEGFDFTCKKMVMFQIGDEQEQFVVDTRHVSIEPLREVLESHQIIKIFHNAKFDYKFIKRWAGIEVRNIYDTYLTERVLHCGKLNWGYSLSKCCERYVGVTLDKEERNKFVGLQGQPFTHNQITYGANDVIYLLRIWEKQHALLDEADLHKVADLENQAVIVFSEIEYEGLQVDRNRWTDLAKDNLELATNLELQLDREVIEHPKLSHYHVPVQQDMFLQAEEQRATNIKWSSPSQMLALFQNLVPRLEDVNGKNLNKHKYRHPIIKSYIKYKELSKLANAYGTNFFNYVNCDGKVHTNFSQILDTGRVSSSEPNMQQIPSDNRYRNCFICPDGWLFVSSDYSSQELNVIAFGSKDPVFLEALEKGQDLHSVCADLVFQDQWTNAADDDCAFMRDKSKCSCSKHKEMRTKVKTINFGLAYGMGPHKLSDTLDISVKEASELIDKYFTAFPNIKKFLDMLGRYGKMNGYIRTFKPFKRKRFFDYWEGRNTPPKEMGMIERASKNTPIQGASADMTKLALVKIHNYIKDNNLQNDIKIVMTVHDQIDTICREELAPRWEKEMTRLMEEAALTIVTNGLLKADTNISKTWEK
jgi:DNA polymerase-1